MRTGPSRHAGFDQSSLQSRFTQPFLHLGRLLTLAAQWHISAGKGGGARARADEQGGDLPEQGHYADREAPPDEIHAGEIGINSNRSARMGTDISRRWGRNRPVDRRACLQILTWLPTCSDAYQWGGWERLLRGRGASRVSECRRTSSLDSSEPNLIPLRRRWCRHRSVKEPANQPTIQPFNQSTSKPTNQPTLNQK